MGPLILPRAAYGLEARSRRTVPGPQAAVGGAGCASRVPPLPSEEAEAHDRQCEEAPQQTNEIAISIGVVEVEAMTR